MVACIFSIFIGYLSDHYQKRGILIISSVPLGIAGFFMLEFLPASMPAAKYGALYLAASGIYAFLPLWLAWVRICNLFRYFIIDKFVHFELPLVELTLTLYRS